MGILILNLRAEPPPHWNEEPYFTFKFGIWAITVTLKIVCTVQVGKYMWILIVGNHIDSILFDLGHPTPTCQIKATLRYTQHPP